MCSVRRRKRALARQEPVFALQADAQSHPGRLHRVIRMQLQVIGAVEIAN